MTGGLTDRNNTPFGTWQFRFIDWFRDLGFLQKPGIETNAAKDETAFVSETAADSSQRERSQRQINGSISTTTVSK
jgi:hypothetical protein